MMVADWYTDTERGIFLDGLTGLDASCRTAYGTEFLEHNPMPMRYDGDFDFAKVGTHWSH